MGGGSGAARTRTISASASSSVKIQVVLLIQKPDGTSPGGTRTLSLTTSPNGKFNVSDLIPASFPPECTPAPSVAALIKIGNMLDGTLTPMPDGRFQVHLALNYKSAVGCRQAGNPISPVVSDEKTVKDAVVSDGEVIPLSVKRSDGETLKVDVTLAVQK